MKKILFGLAFGVMFVFGVSYAQEVQETQDAQDVSGVQVVSAPAAQNAPEVEKFYSDYVKEVKEEVAQAGHWEFAAALRVGSATYRENVEGVESKCSVVLPELVLQAKNRTSNNLESQIDFSWGQSNSATERWEANEFEFQTNKMNFSRLNVKGSIGKVLFTDRVPELEIIPFIGYGFRYIDFDRSDFNLLNVPVDVGRVSEQYYLHHADAGLKLAKKFNERLALSGMATYGYLFSNLARNSALGTVRGTDGRYIIDTNISLQYSVTDRLKFDVGGFMDLQQINGGQSAVAIWPDNKLNFFGGQVGARLVF